MHRHADTYIGQYGDVADVTYRQYFLIKAATLLLCTECSETEVVTSSLIG